MSSRKRQLVEVQNLTELQEPIANARLHAAVMSISSVKKGKKPSFNGQLTDGVGELRMVGFNTHHQQKMSEFKTEHRPIKLENCEIKQSRQGHKMEVLLKNTTKISESCKKIELPEGCDEVAVVTDLANLPFINNF